MINTQESKVQLEYIEKCKALVAERYDHQPAFFIQNAGCQMNSLQTETVAGIVKKMGYEEVSREEDADVVIYNTCTVRENANLKIYGHLGHLKSIKKQKKEMKIVFLDAASIGADIDLSGFDALGEVKRYDYSTSEEAAERITDADVVVINKIPINETTLKKAKNLKLVCVTATGTDNLDKDYLEKRGIAWRNVAGYSTESVAQHTFALLFYLYEKLRYYDDYVKTEQYIGDRSFSHFGNVFHEISGKTWGIIGLGAIGRRVADLAKAFGCHVIYYSTSGKNTQPGYERTDLDTLLRESDIVSVHAPLTDATRGLMNREAFEKMKPTAVFLNVGRGPIVVEKDLAEALKCGQIAAAGLDVLSAEPMREDNPLREIKDSNRLFITPHIAWASVEARTGLMDIVLHQIREFFE